MITQVNGYKIHYTIYYNKNLRNDREYLFSTTKLYLQQNHIYLINDKNYFNLCRKVIHFYVKYKIIKIYV